ncbi:TerD family protein [Streptomyces sp. MI02-7b]|uniref:TerD family protein n=1 Tax=Streptomyces sp. MI02-7b TaxID=462941 RepID=UPI0029AA62D9|nr:TerD family protein [Streptomyces sp. MI02-7b]MDX3074355.1 TerD family protein [Streptomyces sp. MI02-7b]
MTAELVHGQNHPLPGTRVEIRVSAGTAVVPGVTLGDGQGRVSGPDAVALPGSGGLPGIEMPSGPASEHRLAVDLDAVPAAVERVHVLLALPAVTGAPTRFGVCAAPHLALVAPGGAEIASFTVTGLRSESAIVALELYRRQGAWKVRALGQGYAGGLLELLRDQGLSATDAGRLAAALTAPAPGTGSDAPSAPPVPSQARDRVPPRERPRPEAAAGRRAATSPTTPPAPPTGTAPAAPPAPVAGDAAGRTLEERLYNQVWGMFEDLSRAIAAYRSAVDFAESRLDRELDAVLADPRTRVGPAAEAARDQARARQAELVDRARAVLDRDLAQLAAERDVVEPALPPPFAGWESPVWHGWTAPTEPPMAVRLGDLHLPERPELRIPMLVRLPLERGLWVDSAQDRRGAVDVAVALAARLLASHPAGEFAVRVVDPAGSATGALAPFTDSGALREPPATGAAGVAALVARLTQRVDLVQMALDAGGPVQLPPGFDPARQLLVVNDFPYGFDDRTITQLRYLADEGPQVGVHLLLVADREDAREYGPVLDPLWRSLLRLTPSPDDHLADPWVGHAWTYEPPLAPPGSQVVPRVLRQVAAARRTYDRGRR